MEGLRSFATETWIYGLPPPASMERLSGWEEKVFGRRGQPTRLYEASSLQTVVLLLSNSHNQGIKRVSWKPNIRAFWTGSFYLQASSSSALMRPIRFFRTNLPSERLLTLRPHMSSEAEAFVFGL